MSPAADPLSMIMRAQCAADGTSANTVSELVQVLEPPELYRPTEAAVPEPAKSVIQPELSTTTSIQPFQPSIRHPDPNLSRECSSNADNAGSQRSPHALTASHSSDSDSSQSRKSIDTPVCLGCARGGLTTRRKNGKP